MIEAESSIIEADFHLTALVNFNQIRTNKAMPNDQIWCVFNISTTTASSRSTTLTLSELVCASSSLILCRDLS